jgi:seryl-tRNA synthetase
VLDLRYVRDNADLVKARLAVRGKPELPGLVDQLITLDEERRALIVDVDTMRAERNEVSPRVGQLKKEGRHEEADRLVVAMRELNERLASKEARASEVDGEVEALLLSIPNVPADVVPAGGEACNVIVREWGEARTFEFEPVAHWDLAERLGIIDLPRGAKIAGSGFPVYVGAGARLVRGLIDMMLDLHTTEHGYTELAPPFVVNPAAALGTGHLPKFGEDMYHVTGDDLYLVPTAELPVTNLYAGEILPPESVPRRFVAYTPCFRREAGAHGKDTRGILRVHQFDKVELVRFERPEDGMSALEELTSHAEAVLRKLGLRYRVVLLAGGDLGFANAQTFDIEVWAPGVGRWLEVSSCSIYGDYQARRANIRYRPAPGVKPEFVTTLNGSALALPRTVIAVLENGQQADGSIRLPESIADHVRMDRIAG